MFGYLLLLCFIVVVVFVTLRFTLFGQGYLSVIKDFFKSLKNASETKKSDKD